MHPYYAADLDSLPAQIIKLQHQPRAGFEMIASEASSLKPGPGLYFFPGLQGRRRGGAAAGLVVPVAVAMPAG